MDFAYNANQLKRYIGPAVCVCLALTSYGVSGALSDRPSEGRRASRDAGDAERGTGPVLRPVRPASIARRAEPDRDERPSADVLPDDGADIFGVPGVGVPLDTGLYNPAGLAGWNYTRPGFDTEDDPLPGLDDTIALGDLGGTDLSGLFGVGGAAGTPITTALDPLPRGGGASPGPRIPGPGPFEPPAPPDGPGQPDGDFLTPVPAPTSAALFGAAALAAANRRRRG